MRVTSHRECRTSFRKRTRTPSGVVGGRVRKRTGPPCRSDSGPDRATPLVGFATRSRWSAGGRPSRVLNPTPPPIVSATGRIRNPTLGWWGFGPVQFGILSCKVLLNRTLRAGLPPGWVWNPTRSPVKVLKATGRFPDRTGPDRRVAGWDLLSLSPVSNRAGLVSLTSLQSGFESDRSAGRPWARRSHSVRFRIRPVHGGGLTVGGRVAPSVPFQIGPARFKTHPHRRQGWVGLGSRLVDW